MKTEEKVAFTPKIALSMAVYKVVYPNLYKQSSTTAKMSVRGKGGKNEGKAKLLSSRAGLQFSDGHTIVFCRSIGVSW